MTIPSSNHTYCKLVGSNEAGDLGWGVDVGEVSSYSWRVHNIVKGEFGDQGRVLQE